MSEDPSQFDAHLLSDVHDDLLRVLDTSVRPLYNLPREALEARIEELERTMRSATIALYLILKSDT